MSHFDKMDKHIRRQMENHELPVPDGIWENIQKQREKKKVGFLNGSSKYITGIILLLLGFGFWYSSAPNKNVKLNTEIVQDQTILKENDSRLEDTKIDSEFTTQTNSSKTLASNDLLNKDLNKNIAGKNDINGVKESLSKGNKHIQKPEAEVRSTLIPNPDNKAVSQTSIKEKYVSRRSHVDSPKETKAQETLVINDNASHNEPSHTNYFVSSDFSSSNKRQAFEASPLLASRSSLIKQVAPIRFKKYRDDFTCIDNKRKNHFVYFDFLISPEYAVKNLKITDPEFEDYLLNREETESYDFAFSAGARASLVFENGLSFRAGFLFSQVTELFDFYDPEAEVEVLTNVAIDTIINAPMDTTFIWDTISIVQTGERIKKTYNRYKYFDFPVMIGFEKDLNRKWMANVNTGMSINILSWQKGDFLSPLNEPVNFEDNQQVFKDRVGLSLIGSIGINYKISRYLQWVIEPHFKYYLKPITVDNFPVEQQYFNVGIYTGIRLKLSDR